MVHSFLTKDYGDLVLYAQECHRTSWRCWQSGREARIVAMSLTHYPCKAVIGLLFRRLKSHFSLSFYVQRIYEHS